MEVQVGGRCRWEGGAAQTHGSSFLSYSGECLSSKFDAIAIMSLVMFKGKFERFALSLSWFKLLRQSSFLWFRRLNVITSPNKIDLNIVFTVVQINRNNAFFQWKILFLVMVCRYEVRIGIMMSARFISWLRQSLCQPLLHQI